MFINKTLCKKDYIEAFSQKFFAMTPQEKQQFFYGEFYSKQKSQPRWVGVDYASKTDKTIKFRHTGSILEII